MKGFCFIQIIIFLFLLQQLHHLSISLFTALLQALKNNMLLLRDAETFNISKLDVLFLCFAPKTVHFPPLVAQVTPTKTPKKDTASPEATKEQVNTCSSHTKLHKTFFFTFHHDIIISKALSVSLLMSVLTLKHSLLLHRFLLMSFSVVFLLN